MAKSTSRTMPCGFTLIELIVWGVIIVMLTSAVNLCLANVAQSKNRSKLRLDAFMRADTALNALRKDIISILRHDDLFFTRLLITDDQAFSSLGELDSDEILLFNTMLRPNHDIEFGGEGIEYETQYRLSPDHLGPVLWQRRDAIPDSNPEGGGVATPLVEGIMSLSFEAYDGDRWLEEWDSDESGLPHAIRIQITATGQRIGEDEDDPTIPIATLRTVVPIDRVVVPFDVLAQQREEEELFDLSTVDASGQDGGEEDGQDGQAGSGGSGNDGPGRGGRDGRGDRGGRGGGDRGGGGSSPDTGQTGGPSSSGGGSNRETQSGGSSSPGTSEN